MPPLPASFSAAAAATPAAAAPAAASGAVTSARRTFGDLGVGEEWVRRLRSLGIVSPTPAQEVALPVLLGHQHAVLKAETGSGKTLCYLLPILAALKARADALPAGGQLLPVGLVVVPTQELVAQVVAAAAALLPEHAAMVRPCHGSQGLTRRQNCGLIVATPRGVRESVNAVHLGRLLYCVLDEADALLAGQHRADTVGAVLTPFKLRQPEDRPMHIFCAATLPARGTASVMAFLDRYYPAADAVRIETAGSHRAAARLRQTFLQLDAAVPPTLFEREKVERLTAKVTRMAAEINNGGAREGAAAETAAAAAEAADADAEDEYEEGAGFDAEAEEGAEDPLGRTMEGRLAEDRLLEMQADEARYLKKVDVLRREAVVEALLAPAHLLRMRPAAEGGQVAAAEVEEVEEEAPPPTPTSARKERVRPSAVLGYLTEERPQSPRKARGEARRVKEGADMRVTVETLGDGEGEDGATVPPPPPSLQPYRPPERARPNLSAGEAALVPPTLVFANSAGAVEALRKHIAARCPTLRVAELHGEVSEAARVARLADFAAGRIRVLVATNLAARGLDTVNVAHVIQADFAPDVVSHLHRIGRTARAGRAGMVTNLVTRGNLDVVQVLLEAAAGGDSLDAAFSHKRSLRRRIKRGALTAASDALVMSALQAEAAELEMAGRGGGEGAGARKGAAAAAEMH
jgi:superfamily II DNA/RNA helicase